MKKHESVFGLSCHKVLTGLPLMLLAQGVYAGTTHAGRTRLVARLSGVIITVPTTPDNRKRAMQCWREFFRAHHYALLKILALGEKDRLAGKGTSAQAFRQTLKTNRT